MLRGLTLVALAASLSYAALASEDHVVKLTADNFEDKVTDGKVYFIKFFAPWCGHCKRLAPTWGELAAKLKHNKSIVIANVDCTVHKDVCGKAEVRGYPTLKVYHGGEAKEQYRGARDLDSLKKFVEGQKRTLLDETTA